MASRCDEIQTCVDTGIMVDVQRPLDLQLFLQIVFKLFIYVLYYGFVTVREKKTRRKLRLNDDQCCDKHGLRARPAVAPTASLRKTRLTPGLARSPHARPRSSLQGLPLRTCISADQNQLVHKDDFDCCGEGFFSVSFALFPSVSCCIMLSKVSRPSIYLG